MTLSHTRTRSNAALLPTTLSHTILSHTHTHDVTCNFGTYKVEGRMSKSVTKNGVHLGHSQVETQINAYVQDNMIHRYHSRLQQTKRHYIVRFFFPKTCCDKWAKPLPTTRPTNLIPPHHGSTTGDVVRIHPEGRWQFLKFRLQKINV